MPNPAIWAELANRQMVADTAGQYSNQLIDLLRAGLGAATSIPVQLPPLPEVSEAMSPEIVKWGKLLGVTDLKRLNAMAEDVRREVASRQTMNAPDAMTPEVRQWTQAMGVTDPKLQNELGTWKQLQVAAKQAMQEGEQQRAQAQQPGGGVQQMMPPPPATPPVTTSPERMEADAWGRMQPGTQMHVLSGELPGMDWQNAPRDILPQLSPAARSQLRANAMLQDPAYQQYAQNVDAAKAAAAIGETPTHPGYLVGASLNRDFPVYTPEERKDIEKKRQGAVAKRNAELDERKLAVKARGMGKDPMRLDLEQRLRAGEEPGLMDILMVGGPQGLEAANARDPQVIYGNALTALAMAAAKNPAGVDTKSFESVAKGLANALGVDAGPIAAMDEMSQALAQSKGNMRAFMQILENMGKSPEEINAAVAKYFPANKPGVFGKIGEGLQRLLEGSSTNGVPDVPGGFMAAG
jgi:hypothetical protein